MAEWLRFTAAYILVPSNSNLFNPNRDLDSIFGEGIKVAMTMVILIVYIGGLHTCVGAVSNTLPYSTRQGRARFSVSD